MNAHTRLSAKGQVIIPKGVRDSHNWHPGTEFEVVDQPDGVLLRRATIGERKLTVQEFWARNPPHEGPTVTLEEMNEGVMRIARESWPPRTG